MQVTHTGLQGKMALVDFVYDFYLKNFGMVNISEKKLIVFMTSIQKHLAKPRVNLFARMIGLVPEDSLLLEDVIFYLKSVFFILGKNCTPEKLKTVWRMGEKKGRILLKNPKLNGFCQKLENCASKKAVARFKKSIEKESQGTGKERLFDLDAILKSAIVLRRRSFRPPPVHVQIFETFRTISGGGLLFPSVFSLVCKHFLTPHVSEDFELSEYKLESPMDLEEFQELLSGLVRKHVIDMEQLLSKNLTEMSNRLSMKSAEGAERMRSHEHESPRGEYKSLEKNLMIPQSKSVPSEEYQKFFNLEKIKRAKLTKEGVDLKIYFQEHGYEIKNDLIKYYRKLNFTKSKYNSALRFLFAKVARKFELYTFHDITEFFISFYVIKKEVNLE